MSDNPADVKADDALVEHLRHIPDPDQRAATLLAFLTDTALHVSVEAALNLAYGIEPNIDRPDTNEPQRSLYAQMFRREMSARLILDVARLYDELSHLTGPSKTSMTKARRSGYHPPAAWDDHTIDDPDSLPNLGEADPSSSLGDEVWHLWRGGVAEWEIADRLGVTESYVRRQIRERRLERVAS